MSAQHLRPAPQWPVFCFVFLFSFSCSYKIEYFPQGRVTNRRREKFLTGEPHWVLKVDRGARAAQDGWMECFVAPITS